MMKRFTMFLSMFAIAAAIVSCENADMDDVVSSDGSSSVVADAYLSVTIGQAVTRADVAEGTDGYLSAASGSEIDVNTVTLLAFDKTQNLIEAYEGTKTTTSGVWNFKVPSSAYYFLAIVNENAEITSAIDKVTTTANHSWTMVYSELSTVSRSFSTPSSLTQETNGGIASEYFPMINEGTYVSSSTNSVLVTASDYPLSTSESKPSTTTIIVDRLAAKFVCATAAGDAITVKEGTYGYAKYQGVRLNATNRLGFIYSPITLLTSYLYDYRVDPNMEIEYDSSTSGIRNILTTNFNWLDNAPTASHSTNATTVADYFTAYNNGTVNQEYVLENTAAPSHQDYNNLTQAIVKIEYVPGNLVTAVYAADESANTPGAPSSYTYNESAAQAGETWYAIHTEIEGTRYYTFDGVVSFYNYLAAPYDTDVNTDDGNTYYGTENNVAIAALMDKQLQYILTTYTGTSDTTTTWATVDQTTFEAIPNLGYIAATTTTEDSYIVQCYKDGFNYYDVFIMHDSSVAAQTTGRWGMVRNNLYNLTVASVSGPGLPYIPDPTDPDITDPDNPDPTDPEPADTEYGYLDVTITMNPWTNWYQSADLGESDFEL